MTVKEEPMRAFNLFRRKSEHDFCCAVPEGAAVPGFLNDETWEFSARMTDDDNWPSHFHAVSARACARFNGFYLFQNCQ